MSGSRLIEAESSQPVGLDDCAVCVGVPIERASFEACVASLGDHHFIESHVAASGRRDWESYAPSNAYPLIASLERWSRRGVQTIPFAGLKDLSEVIGSKRVVVLLTHWRGAEPFKPEDIVDPHKLLRLVAGADREVHLEIATAVRELGFERYLEVQGESFNDKCIKEMRENLADVLTALVQTSYRSVDVAAAEVELSMEKALRRAQRCDCLVRLGRNKYRATRLMIEMRCDGAVRNGHPLELADGMHAASDIVELLPKGDREWRYLDLMMCNSTQLLEVVRRERRNIRVLGHQMRVSPVNVLPVMDRTFEILEKQPCSYFQARALAIEVVRELSGVRSE